MNHWVTLALAVVAEVIATSSLKATSEFTRFWPSLLVMAGYLAAFYFMTLSLRTLPVGIMYAIWAGAGIVLVTVIGWLVYRQGLDLPAVIGIGLIVAGVVIINVFSRAVVH
jgi:small multidrug resistance pump